MEKQRRWALRRQRSFVEDTRDGLQREGAGSAQPEMRGMCRVARLPSHLANISVIYLAGEGDRIQTRKHLPRL
jgi:hypothetical protein